MAKKVPQKKNNNNLITFLTVFVLTTVILIGAYYLLIHFNPNFILNPFPPTPLPPNISQQQVDFAMSQTLAMMPATPSPTIHPSLTQTQTLTVEPISPTPTSTKTLVPGTPTPTPDQDKLIIHPYRSTLNPDAIFYTTTPTPKTGYIFPFIMVSEPTMKESPYNENVVNPLLNCKWVGVAGQVFDILGKPLNGITIRLSGSIDGTEIKQRTMQSGDANLLGEGGYEFMLAEKPFSSQNALWLQVLDAEGEPLSAKAHFKTTVHCTQNLIQIDFIQVK